MPGGALEGLCPKCIGKVTFGLDSNGEPVPSPAGSEPPPPPAEPGGTAPTVPDSAPVSEQPGDRIGPNSDVKGFLLARQLRLREALPLLREIVATGRFQGWAAPEWKGADNLQELAQAAIAEIDRRDQEP